VSASKKSTGQYSAAHAALGGRTLKTGQSRCFVGYKKHTLRLWLHHYLVGVQLVPLVSWVTPANVSEGGLLVPSLHYCQQQWDWCPPLVVADMGYLAAAAKQQCRERWRVAVLTKLRSDMKLVPPYVAWDQAACPQGEPLTWLGYDGRAGEHWLASAPNRSCAVVVGKRRAARGNLPIGQRSTRRCWVGYRWPADWRNKCCSRCVRGLNRRSPSRRTNWAWATCSSTACGSLG
jgi:hypothetical protein